MITSIFVSSVCMGELFTLGSSTCTPVVRSGAVTMKMTSRTSMTSMSGVTLMSFIPPMRRPLARPPAPPMPPAPMAGLDPSELGAGRDVGGEAFHEVRDLPHPAREVVVRHDRRDRGHQADRGRDERLGDLGRD